MSRESTYPLAQSTNQPLYTSTNHQIDLENLPPSYQTLLAKQQEYAALQALKEASGEMVKRIEKLSEMSHIMADGGEALGGVMKNWPHVFSVLNLVDKQPEIPTSPGETMEEEQEPIPPLVRLPYTNDQSPSQ